MRTHVGSRWLFSYSRYGSVDLDKKNTCKRYALYAVYCYWSHGCAILFLPPQYFFSSMLVHYDVFVFQCHGSHDMVIYKLNSSKSIIYRNRREESRNLVGNICDILLSMHWVLAKLQYPVLTCILI